MPDTASSDQTSVQPPSAGLPLRAFNDLTRQSASEAHYNIYVPITALQSPPESFQQYLFTRKVNEEDFTKLVDFEYMVNTGGSLTRATPQEHKSAVAAAFNVIESYHNNERSKAHNRINEEYIPTSALLTNALNNIAYDYAPRRFSQKTGSPATRAKPMARISIRGIRHVAGEIFDKIITSIRHTTEYNLNPFLQDLSKDEVIAKMETQYNNSNQLMNELDVIAAIGQEIASILPDPDLEFAVTCNRDSFWTAAGFQSEKAIRNREKFLNQYNPNRSATDIATTISERWQISENDITDTEREKLTYVIAQSLAANSGIPLEKARALLHTGQTYLSFSNSESNMQLTRKSDFGEEGDKIMRKYLTLIQNNKELGVLIEKCPVKLQNFAIAAVFAQDAAANWLTVEKQENSFYTGSHCILKLLKSIPQMSMEDLKQTFPDSFTPNRSDADTRKILIYNSRLYTQHWEEMSRIASYTCDVQHGIISHSNILTNIQKEGYTYAALIFPELDQHIEYLDKRAEEVNKRQSTSVCILGNLTKDYFLDALLILKGGAGGKAGKVLNQVLAAREGLTDYYQYLAATRKAKREGKSWQQITAEGNQKLVEIYGIKLSGHWGGKIGAIKIGKGKYANNLGETITTIEAKETVKTYKARDNK